MFSKFLSFVLVYILSVVNFVIILSPVVFLVIPFIYFQDGMVNRNIASIVLLLAAFVSALMLLMLFFDFIFGFSVRRVIKGAKNYLDIDKMGFLGEPFEEIKQKYGVRRAKLLIAKDDDVNAYAVGGLGRKYIVLTTGLIAQYMTMADDRSSAIAALKGVMGHEMSHLVNRDYLPGLLLTVNEQATAFFSKIVMIFFVIIVRIISIIPLIGNALASVIMQIYNTIDYILKFFSRYVILGIYKFIQLQISRNIEYRSDYQSGLACGGSTMAFALSFLGDSGYTSIFSTHPSTASRIERLEGVKQKNRGRVRPTIRDEVINMTSILVIVVLCAICFFAANIPALLESYNAFDAEVNNQYLNIKYRIDGFINKWFRGGY